MPNPSHPESNIRVAAYPAAWRVVSGALFALSRLSILIILAILVIGTETPVAEPLLVRLVLVFSLLPGLAAALIRRAFAFDAEVREGNLILYRRGQQITVNLSKIAAIAPWRIPLPGPGLAIWATPDGRPPKYLLQVDNLDGLLRKISESGNAPPVNASQALVIYAQARYAAGLAAWQHLLFKFGVFPLLPAVIFFRLHQYITHGSAFGEYQFHGLNAYLSTFAFYWIMMAVYMLLYASVWRVLAEGISLAAARIIPARAVTLRWWTERAVMILYYGGVPALVGLRFLV